MSSSTRMTISRSVPKKSAVVIDLGSAFIKCGFAGEPRPLQVIPSVIGSEDMEVPSRTREEWTDIFTEFFSKLYTETLQCRPRDRRVVLCESMVCPRELREAVAHVLFRYLQVPAIHLCPGPATALYCTGLDTGIALDIGAREAHVVAVYRGSTIVNSYAARCAFIAALREAVPLGCYAVQERVREMIVEDESKQEGGAQEGGAQEGGEGVSGGGKEMYGEAKDQGKDSCDEAGGNGGPSEGWRRALTQREIEEVTLQGCLVPVRGVPNVGQVLPMEWVFTGKRKVTASATVRTCAVEQALFEGDEEGRTLPTLILDCLRRCPRDCRMALVQTVLVCGGGALFPGLCARLGEEIRALARAANEGGEGSAISRLGAPEGYSWARAMVFGRGDSDQAAAEASSGRRGDGGLCVMRAPIARNLLLWTGASIMACLTGVAERSLTSEQYVARGGRIPDWMSVSPSDWLFSAPPSATRASAGVPQ